MKKRFYSRYKKYDKLLSKVISKPRFDLFNNMFPHILYCFEGKTDPRVNKYNRFIGCLENIMFNKCLNIGHLLLFITSNK